MLVDDVNEIQQLDAFVEMLMRREDIKCIATVRDYAHPEAKKYFGSLKSWSEYVLGPLRPDAIDNILEKSFGISDSRIRLRICDISKGNLRFAYYASLIANNRGIANLDSIESVLDNCYDSLLAKLPPSRKDSLTIAALLGSHEVEKDRKSTV